MRPPVTELNANGAHGVGDVSPGCDVMGWPFGGLSLKPHDPDAVMRRASGEAESRDTLQAPGQCVSELPRSPHVRPLADQRRLAGLRGREGHSHWGVLDRTGGEARAGRTERGSHSRRSAMRGHWQDPARRTHGRAQPRGAAHAACGDRPR